MENEEVIETEVEEDEDKPSYKIFQASPEVLKKCDPDRIGVGIASRQSSKGQAKYPFAELLVGECFIVSFLELEPTTLQNIRSAASTNGRRRSRKFVVVIHRQYDCVEVARIA